MSSKRNIKHRLPAEWEKHEATWIGWPHNKNDWPGKFSPIKWIYCDIVKNICEAETVRILVQSSDHKKQAISALQSAGVNLNNVEFFIRKTNRGWLRDSSPFYVREKEKLVALDFKFNAWAKYDDYNLDNKIPSFICKKFGLKRITTGYNGKPIVLEGGSIDTNGKGTLITTEECLLDDKIQIRNPGFTKKDYENIFNQYFGISKTIWLGKGIAGDDTHGHVDDLCRFVHENTVVLVQEEKLKDENHKTSKENMERLQGIILQDGSKLNVISLPMPSPVIFKGQRLPASYANFYISNRAVLVPTFNDVNDKKALAILSELFPGRKVAGIHSTDLVWGLGTIHCLTHEQPFYN